MKPSIQLTLCIAALGTLTIGPGCILRRLDLRGADAGAVEDDAFSSDDAFSPDDAPIPVDAFRPIDAFLPIDACTPSCGTDDMLNDCVSPPRPCTLGCASSTRCRDMIFSNVDQTEISDRVRAATEPLNEPESREIGDCASAWVTTTGQRVCVHIFSSVDIGGKVSFIGTLPVIILARDFIHISGEVYAGARRDASGPGAVSDGAGGDGANNGVWGDGGGGGGASCGAGGAGGRGDGAAGGGGGSAAMITELEPLVGGAHGGTAPGAGGASGGGGGALQLSSLGEIIITGSVFVGGGGGQRGQASSGNFGGGGGGGGGGGLLLEAPVVNLTGAQLLVSGGGGGGSSGLTSDGQNGGEVTSVRGGDGGSDGLSARGGDGGTVVTGEPGGSNTGSAGNGGGGGGGVGRLVIRQRVGTDAMRAIPPSAPCFSQLDVRTR